MTSEENKIGFGLGFENDMDLIDTIQQVKKKNEEFNRKFIHVSDMIRNYMDGDKIIINDDLADFLDKVIRGRPKENHINLTMTVLDLIYINLSNNKYMYDFPENEDFLTNYDKLKEIEKRYEKLVESVRRS